MTLLSYKNLLTLLNKKLVIIPLVTITIIVIYLFWGYNTYRERAIVLLNNGNKIYSELYSLFYNKFDEYETPLFQELKKQSIRTQEYHKEVDKERGEIIKKINKDEEYILLKKKALAKRNYLHNILDGRSLRSFLHFRLFFNECELKELTYRYSIYNLRIKDGVPFTHIPDEDVASNFSFNKCYKELSDFLEYNNKYGGPLLLSFIEIELFISNGNGYYPPARYIKALADYYDKGEEVRQDKKKAKEYFGLACDKKDTEACKKYAELNEQGF